MNEQDELYGNDRMLHILNTAKGHPVNEILKAVRKDLKDYAGKAPQFDDITMLGLHYNGTGSGSEES